MLTEKNMNLMQPNTQADEPEEHAASREIAEHFARTSYADLPPEAVHATKRLG